MADDSEKTIEVGLFPDWRWRCAMQRLTRLEAATNPEEFFAGVNADVLLADMTLVEFVFPYLKWRLYQDTSQKPPNSRIEAMHHAVDAMQEEVITPNCYSLMLEAGILGKRPLGELLPDARLLSPLAQILYEKAFFDVRPLLDSPRELVTLLFGDRDHMAKRGGYDLM